MRVAVVGGTGCAGQALVPSLLSRGDEVLVISRGPTGAPPPAARWARLERRDAPELRRVLGDFRPDAVVDQIAYQAADAEALLWALPRGPVRLVVASSAIVYGPPAPVVTAHRGRAAPADAPWPEEAPLAPAGPLAQGKVEMEAVVRRHPAASVLRLAWLYGPGHAPLTPFGRDPFLAARLRQGEGIALPADDPPRLQPLFSQDYAALVAALLTHPAPPAVLNVAGDEVLSWGETIAGWALAAGAPPPLLHPMSPADLAALAPAAVRPFLPALLAPIPIDTARLRALLPEWRPRPFLEGARATLA